MTKKYFQTTVQVKVWSEDVPVEFDTLEELEHAIRDGICQGKTSVVEVIPISEEEYTQRVQEGC